MSEQGKIAAYADWIYGEEEAGRQMVPPPEEMVPDDIQAAYLVQDAVLARLAAEGAGNLGGWKIALTTPTMQAFVGAEQPCAGAMFRSRIYQSPQTLPGAAFHHLGVEAEIAVRMGRDLGAEGAPYDRDSVADAVAALMPSIELIDDRQAVYGNFDARLLIAVNSLNAGCVLGPETTDWRGLDLEALAGRMIINGEVVGEGHGRDVLGQPMNAVAWLANNLIERGRQLRAGDVISTGSVVQTRFLDPGDTMATDIDDLGQVIVTIS